MNAIASLALLVQASTVGVGDQSYDEAYENAVKYDRPLVVVVSADWCGACRTMKDQTLPEVHAQGGLKGVELVVIDYDRNHSLAKKVMKGPMIPQVIRFEQVDGKWDIKRLVGAQSADTIRNLASTATEPVKESLIKYAALIVE